MPVMIRIAFRNMWEHKSKSLIIGILIALGCIVLVLGNAMMDSCEKGIRDSFIENFTGDMMISGSSSDAVSIFGKESMSMDSDTTVPLIPDYDKVLDRVAKDSRVKAYTSMSVAYGMLAVDANEDFESSSDSENMVFGIVFGIKPDSYFKMFPSLNVSQGRFLRDGESGVMIGKDQLDKLNKKYKRTFKVGDKLLINGFATSGMRIREVELVGVYDRTATGNAPFIYTDIDTARILSGMTLGTSEDVKLDSTQTSLLSSTDEDSLFGADSGADIVSGSPRKAGALDGLNAKALLGDTSRREKLNETDPTAWNFILIRLKDSTGVNRTMADYSAWFTKDGLDARITNWKGAAGTFGSLADILRTIFTIALLIISVVAVIIMMNTLVVSVVERTAEIGTMRALGAQKSYIRRMFLTENLTLTLVFGVIGSALSVILTFVLNALAIRAPNDLMKLVFGGDILHLVPRPMSFVTAIIMVFIVGYLSHLFPVSVALKIEPVKAMGSE